MEKILITGGNSSVGKALKSLGLDAYYLNGRKDLDLMDNLKVSSFIKEFQPDRVIHLAAKVGGIKDNIENPFEFLYENNIINTNIFSACYENKVKRFTAILSTCIYPDICDNYPIKEEMLHMGPPVRSNFGYAISKRNLALMIDLANESKGTKYNYLSPCNLFGPEEQFNETKSHYLTSLINKFIIAKKSGKKEIIMMGDGKPLRQFILFHDLARVIKNVVDNDITSSFNVAPDYNISISEYSSCFLEAIGEREIKIIFPGEGPNGQFRKDVDNTRLKKYLPNFEFTPLHKALKQTYEKYLERYDNIQ